MTLGQSFENEPNINIVANPVDPEPGERVSIQLSSFETDLDLATIRWSYGNVVQTGIGEKEFTITIPPTGTDIVSVSADISLTSGVNISKSISISIRSYDITWEAVGTRTPPFYLGKKIPIRENNIRVAIISPTSNIKQTVYKWSRNSSSVSSNNTARPFVDFKNSELDKKEFIEAVINSEGVISTKSLNVPISNPKIFFYKYSPLTGLDISKTIKSEVDSYENNVSIFAIPVGLNFNSKPYISWNLSGREISNQDNPYLLSFGAPDESGEVPISLKIEDLRSIYQEFTGSLKLNF